MQTDVLDIRARAVLPRLLEIVRDKAATEAEKTMRRGAPEPGTSRPGRPLIAPTIFREFWNELNRLTWDDETTEAMGRMPRPASQVMVDQVLNDPDAPWFDDQDDAGARTPCLGSPNGPSGRRSPTWRSGWGRAAKPGGGARSRGPRSGTWPGSRASAGRLEADGVGHVIDAIDAVWAPSWRMVVELGPEVKAWGNYPGGQSGNPGSKFYEDRVDDWAAGKPYELVFLKSADEPDPRIVGRTVMRGGK